MSGSITIPSNKVLRGAGMNQTILRKTGSSKRVLTMGSGLPGYWIFNDWDVISSGFAKDHSSISRVPTEYNLHCIVKTGYYRCACFHFIIFFNSNM